MQVGKGRHMQAVVVQNEVGDAVAVMACHAVNVHRLVTQPHEGTHTLGIGGREYIAVKGGFGGETAVAQVEEIAWMVVLKVGKETDEAREAHGENEMKIGKLLVDAVIPFDALADKRKERFVLLFATCGIMQELSQKQRYRKFDGIERNARIGQQQLGVGKMLEIGGRTVVEGRLEPGERLEKLFFQPAFLRSGNPDQKRKTSIQLGQHVDHE